MVHRTEAFAARKGGLPRLETRSSLKCKLGDATRDAAAATSDSIKLRERPKASAYRGAAVNVACSRWGSALLDGKNCT
eukprot:CAMPEP_0196780780 /NCGR_PEP_ID=MMETSP1104-20130614/8492_1 /TAXON_ID=33652 /ORGANISM="Cafeteria sp., Strain Caron Lab Isolate" /LENGTH=77 /DNA_ID=CAMNT_0042150995 /DNA_START=51 /DNA_END=284 /DNA_ORIENTATION=+